MKLDDIIDKLIEIRAKNDCGQVDVHIMEEHEVKGKVMQFMSKVMDIAVSMGKKGASKVIIIGQEID